MIQLRSLDAETLALFADKGQEDPTRVVPQAGNANAVKVRRIMPAQVFVQPAPFRPAATSSGTGPLAKRVIKAALRKIGLEVRRV